MKTALLVVDVQNLLVEDGPYALEDCLQVWQTAIAACRKRDIEVIYVRHNDEELITGSHGWEIYEAVAPQVGEKIFDKHYNSAFKETGLQTYLKERGIGRLIIIGMATNYCIDTTVKVAFELSYDVTVVKGGTTTFDDREITAEQLIKHYENVWNGRFAQVEDLERILKRGIDG